MSATVDTRRSDAELDQLIAETNKLVAESSKMVREAAKLAAEKMKLTAEARKLDRDVRIAPWQIAVVVVGGFSGLIAAIVTSLKAVGVVP